MPAIRLAFTDRSLASLPFAPKGQHLIRDAELPGFFVRIGTKTKAFMVQADSWAGGRRQTLTIKVGEVGELSARDARAKAKSLLGAIADGHDPRPKLAAVEPAPDCTKDLTLSQAWDRYREAHLVRKGRSEKTIQSYNDHFDRLFSDWLDMAIARLGRQPALVRDRHDALTADHGPYMANVAMRSLRAVYNHALKSTHDLPPGNPVTSVDWNPEKRRQTAMGVNDLKFWFDQLSALTNPVRREFHLLLLLSGSRPDALKRARWEHLDLRRRVLHIPKPKGGADRAFDIPLSREMIRCIIRARRTGFILYPASSTVHLFPADSPEGHLIEHKEKRTVLSKWGNDLRQTYRTMGQIAGVHDLDMHLLMNHSIPGVNAGYLSRHQLTENHLRKQQQRISDSFTSAFLGPRDAGKRAHAR